MAHDAKTGVSAGEPSPIEAWSELCRLISDDETISVVDKAIMLAAEPLGVVADVLVIAAQDEMVKSILDIRLRDGLLRRLAGIYGRRIGLAFTADGLVAEHAVAPQKTSLTSRIDGLERRMERVERAFGAASHANGERGKLSELDRAERAEQVRTMLREWNGYDPTPEDERETDALINRAIGREPEAL